MFPLVDIIASVGGLIFPPAFDFLKKRYIKSENDTPERTMGSLAMTKPEVLPEYVKALAVLKDSEVKFFNRDVIGAASQWVVDLRASIRPIGVGCAFAILVWIAYLSVTKHIDNSGLDVATLTGIRVSCEVIISSWFGDRITLK